MPKLILEFNSKEDRDLWLGAYSDGGGEEAVYDCIMEQEGSDTYETPTMKEED